MVFLITVENTTESHWNIIEWSNGTEWYWMVFNGNQWYTISSFCQGSYELGNKSSPKIFNSTYVSCTEWEVGWPLFKSTQTNRRQHQQTYSHPIAEFCWNLWSTPNINFVQSSLWFINESFNKNFREWCPQNPVAECSQKCGRYLFSIIRKVSTLLWP